MPEKAVSLLFFTALFVPLKKKSLLGPVKSEFQNVTALLKRKAKSTCGLPS